jgi:hypothetical protein
MIRKVLDVRKAALALLVASLGTASFAAEKQTETEAQIKRLANDTRFRKVAKDATDAFRKSAEAAYRLAPADRSVARAEIGRYVELLKKQKRAVAPPAQIAKLLPFGQREAELMQPVLGKLRKDYPLVVSQAAYAAAYEAAFKMEYNFHDISESNDTPEQRACVEQCEEEYRRKINEQGLTWFVIAGSTLNPISFLWESGEFASDLIRLQGEEADCRARCYGHASADQCKSNSDCARDQYCRNPAGNPINTCAPKKTEGKTCNNAGQCQTGCCKYNFLKNPFYTVCRPADKCD